MEQDYRAGRHRLPGYYDDAGYSAAPPQAAGGRTRRDEGVRQVRRMSNWTAAALVAGVAVTTGYFAHAATVATVATQQAGAPGTASAGQPGTTAPGHKATLTHPVVTSGGSGVTAGASGGASGSGSAGGDY